MIDSKKLPFIHIIRGFAALFVLVCHSKWIFWIGGTEYVKRYPVSGWGVKDYLLFGLDITSSNGTSMVVIFFVLSGFFIAYSFQKNRWRLSDFYFNRFLRIYIPFLGSLLVAMLLFSLAVRINPYLITNPYRGEFPDLIKNTYTDFDFKTFFYTLLFNRNKDGIYMAMDYPYWSLYHEALFYMLAPLAIRYFKIFFFCGLGFYVISYFINWDQNNMLQAFWLEYLFYFGMGVYAFNLIIKKDIFKVNKFVYLLICFVLLIGVLFSSYKVGHRISLLFGGVLSVLAVNYLVYNNIKESLFIRLSKFLGKISYSVYLFHVPIFIFLFSIITSISKQYFFEQRIYWIASFFCIVMIIPFYYLIEGKSIQLIGNVKKRIKRPVIQH